MLQRASRHERKLKLAMQREMAILQDEINNLKSNTANKGNEIDLSNQVKSFAEPFQYDMRKSQSPTSQQKCTKRTDRSEELFTRALQ